MCFLGSQSALHKPLFIHTAGGTVMVNYANSCFSRFSTAKGKTASAQISNHYPICTFLMMNYIHITTHTNTSTSTKLKKHNYLLIPIPPITPYPDNPFQHVKPQTSKQQLLMFEQTSVSDLSLTGSQRSLLLLFSHHLTSCNVHDTLLLD